MPPRMRNVNDDEHNRYVTKFRRMYVEFAEPIITELNLYPRGEIRTRHDCLYVFPSIEYFNGLRLPLCHFQDNRVDQLSMELVFRKYYRGKIYHDCLPQADWSTLQSDPRQIGQKVDVNDIWRCLIIRDKQTISRGISFLKTALDVYRRVT